MASAWTTFNATPAARAAHNRRIPAYMDRSPIQFGYFHANGSKLRFDGHGLTLENGAGSGMPSDTDRRGFSKIMR
jgi:hypothetical protein